MPPTDKDKLPLCAIGSVDYCDNYPLSKICKTFRDMSAYYWRAAFTRPAKDAGSVYTILRFFQKRKATVLRSLSPLAYDTVLLSAAALADTRGRLPVEGKVYWILPGVRILRRGTEVLQDIRREDIVGSDSHL